jgi:hypothetical protein
MKTVTITELSRTRKLDRPAMAGARGFQKIHQLGDISFFVSFGSSIDAFQDLGQLQEVFNATASGAAFVEGVHVDNDVAQVGQNTIAA